MDAMSETCPRDKQTAYTTSKQVQAWFLGRSRDRWKQKYMDLKAESKRLRQRVADVSRSRDDWRGKAEAAHREAETLRARNAELQARLDGFAGEASPKNARTNRPR
jgi:chromosome segregation ATPase